MFKEKYVTHADVIQDTLAHKPDARSFLEYGSGIGPICASYLEFFGDARSAEFHLADLDSLHLQCAAYRFAKTPNVFIHSLLPKNDLQLSRDIRVDVVFCLTVFEHMNQPLRTAQHFQSLLADGGILAFDYILGAGDGLDTRVAAEQRRDTLEFIETNFDICRGVIEMDRSMGLTICRKRSS